jgi:hypothetical protein
MKHTLLLVLLLAPAAASAGSVANGKIVHVNVSVSGLAYVYTGESTMGPACAKSGLMTIDTATPAGKALYAAALVAYQSGRTVHLIGADACTLAKDAEDMQSLLLD